MVNERERADNPTIVGSIITILYQLVLVAVLIVAIGIAARGLYEGFLLGWNLINL